MSAISPTRTRNLLKKIAGLRILVVGDAMLDHYIWGDATRISPEAPVPVVECDRETNTAGGAANVAANAASLGAAVELVGAIGRDGMEKSSSGTSRAGCPVRPEVSAGRRHHHENPGGRADQQLCRIDAEDDPQVYRAAFAAKKTLALLQRKIARCHGVILSDYAKGLLSTGLIAKIAAAIRAHGGFISLDPKPSGGNQSDGLDLITPNHREAIELSGLKPDADGRIDDASICRRIWEEYHPRNLVVTLGADGMLLSEKGALGRRIRPQPGRSSTSRARAIP